MVYADNAATNGYTLDCVTEAVVHALQNPGNPGRGSHAASLAASRVVFEARSAVSDFFDGYGPSNTVFTSGITMSLNSAIKGIIKKNDHVITTYMEHNSVLRPLYELCEKKDISMTVTAPDAASIEKAIRPETRAVIMMHGSNVTGDVFDIESAGKLCHERNLIFITDTAQTAGVIPISMKKAYIDILCFAGHKGLMGPQGTGGILLSDRFNNKQDGYSLLINPLVTGGSGFDSFNKHHPVPLPTALEAGTLNTPGIAGLGAAVRYISEIGTEKIRKHEIKLAQEFYEGIKELPQLEFYGDYSDFRRRTSIVTFNVKGYEAGSVSDELAEDYGILTRPGAHCAPLVHEHYGTKEQGMVRFSFGYGNTSKDINYCIKAVREMVI